MSGLEGLGIVANVIAVVDLSLKVISWCSKYAKDVKDSSDGRARLLQAAITLHYESEKIRHLLTGKNGSKLKASRSLRMLWEAARFSYVSSKVYYLTRPTVQASDGRCGRKRLKAPFETLRMQQKTY